MPAGGFSASSPPSGMEFEAKITPMVVTSCVTAATGGLMFGYDIGISDRVGKPRINPRKYDHPCQVYDMNPSGQAIPLFLSEIAPTTIRGGLNSLFQINITVGILFANLVNYGTNRIHPWGWRLSLSLAGFPAVLFTLGAFFMVDTPNSLIERGRQEEGKFMLKKIRGTDNVEPEFNEIVEASRIAHDIKNPFRSLLQRHNRPLLMITILLQMFQQLTGINAIMFYAPVLLTTLGFKTEASLYSAVITGAVNVLSTFVSMYTVDRVGRRMLLLDAGVQMFLSLVAMAVVMRTRVTDRSDHLGHDWAIMVVVIICNFVSSFAWSWGPLGWLIPSETFPLETRSAGQSISVCTNLLFTFVFAQVFLSMLCRLKSFIFVFFSVCVAIMSLFVLFFLPETKNIPIEEMAERVWKLHWFWKQLMNDGEGSSTACAVRWPSDGRNVERALSLSSPAKLPAHEAQRDASEGSKGKRAQEATEKERGLQKRRESSLEGDRWRPVGTAALLAKLRVVLPSLIPHVGMEFKNSDEAWSFWLTYSIQKGFEARKRFFTYSWHFLQGRITVTGKKEVLRLKRAEIVNVSSGVATKTVRKMRSHVIPFPWNGC
ncbi:Sugar transport protein 13 [Triticum urartu]|uniref:Sugar transport protein 13 n=1 Tax=Triticum urartu TaxID=4572 RepID=M7ZRT3_TRIUA|nr:Sugar transport protein 13 [Triticum urartu]